MKTDKLVDAIGMIDERKLLYAKLFTAKDRRKSPGKAASWAAAVDPAYQILFNISPTAAQTLKPVNLSCEDQGIRMDVISSAIYENEAVIYLSLQDLTDNRIDKTAAFLIHIGQWNNKKNQGG